MHGLEMKLLHDILGHSWSNRDSSFPYCDFKKMTKKKSAILIEKECVKGASEK
jgi:hypothetical protein